MQVRDLERGIDRLTRELNLKQDLEARLKLENDQLRQISECELQKEISFLKRHYEIEMQHCRDQCEQRIREQQDQLQVGQGLLKQPSFGAELSSGLRGLADREIAEVGVMQHVDAIQRRKIISDLGYMVEQARHEIQKLKQVLKKPSIQERTDKATSPLRQQTAPIPSDELFLTEFQLQITEFSALIGQI